MGMAMTEKQGGSDVRANTTRAEHLTVLSTRCRATSGSAPRPCATRFSCWRRRPAACRVSFSRGGLPTAKRTPFHIQRLKSKLGNRSNASSEVEFDGAWARRIGDEGRGVATIIEMVHHTRLDCVMGSAALMRPRAG